VPKGGIVHPQLNIREKPIEKKYRDANSVEEDVRILQPLYKFGLVFALNVSAQAKETPQVGVQSDQAVYDPS
jgi:hypothetical protein